MDYIKVTAPASRNGERGAFVTLYTERDSEVIDEDSYSFLIVNGLHNSGAELTGKPERTYIDRSEYEQLLRHLKSTRTHFILASHPPHQTPRTEHGRTYSSRRGRAFQPLGCVVWQDA